MFRRIYLFFLMCMKGDEKDMVAVYVALIIAGRRTYKQVPVTLKEQVREELYALDLAHLVEE